MRPAPLLPPNPSLLALILIIRTRSGPRFVFHYPGVPTPSATNNSSHFGSAGSDSESSDSSSDDDDATIAGADDDDNASRTRHAHTEFGHGSAKSGYTATSKTTPGTGFSRRTARTLREDGPDEEEDDDEIEPLDLTDSSAAGPQTRNVDNKGSEEEISGQSRSEAEWERLLGYSTEGLEKMLCPPRSMRKKRFEVMVEDVVFLGYPVFVRENGIWEKKRKKKDKASKKKSGLGASEVDQEIDETDEENATDKEDHFEDQSQISGRVTAGTNTDILKQSEDVAVTDDDDHHSTNADPSILHPVSSSFVSEATAKSVSTGSGSGSNNGDEMTMFHVVFVMNPPALEYQVRVRDMYNNVVKKFSKALKYEQVRSDYVWKEASKIQALKAQAKENKTPMSRLWPRIIAESLLARSIASVYTCISASKIAHVNIAARFDASLQIPQAISTPYAPTPIEPQPPGLWLTTSSMLQDDDVVGTSLSPHAALLLLEDKETLLKEIEGDNKELATPLAYFIRGLTPTKTLQKLSSALSLPLTDLQFLARHLIYWRRARAIPPLHVRDTYIVSPNCDLRQLSKATELFSQRFSALPSLPKMLQSLSSKPVQWGFLVPSKDHKAAYMDILAWLLRGGWLTQVRTFAWVKVTPRVKAAVAVQMRKEAAEKRLKKATRAKRVSNSSDSAPSWTQRRAATNEDDSGSDAFTSRKSSIASPRISGLLSPSRAASDAGSIGSGRTAIPIPALAATMPSPALRPSPLSAIIDGNDPPSPPSILSAKESNEASEPEPETEAETEPSAQLPPVEEGAYETSLIMSPHRASAEESGWLKFIGDELRDAEVREYWPVLNRYFDGQRGLEEIAAREGLKRAKVAGLIAALEKEGVLCVVRHW